MIRKQPKFNKTNQEWNDYHYNSRKNIGTISALFRSAHEKYKVKNKSLLMLFQQWQTYYIESGKERAKLIAQNGDKEEYQMNYGRTLDDIEEMAVSFQKDCMKESISLTLSEAFNYCYIRIIDEGYLGYQRELAAILFLQSHYPSLTFSFANSYEDIYLGVDIKVYKKNQLIGGIQVKSPVYKDSASQYNAEAKILQDKKFERCHKELHILPQYLYISWQGIVSEPMPVFA